MTPLSLLLAILWEMVKLYICVCVCVYVPKNREGGSWLIIKKEVLRGCRLALHIGTNTCMLVFCVHE